MIAKLIEFSLKYKLLMFILFLSVCAGGTYSLTRLSIDAFPDISPNLVQVFAEVEGMAAEETEQFVTRPVEVAMRGIPGVTKIRSLSSFGLATVTIYFSEKTDIYRARQLVAERLKEAEESIPEGVMPHGLEMSAIVSGMGKIASAAATAWTAALHHDSRSIAWICPAMRFTRLRRLSLLDLK
jgi:cobalt-zinc-cadmium resistance protein CzcA